MDPGPHIVSLFSFPDAKYRQNPTAIQRTTRSRVIAGSMRIRQAQETIHNKGIHGIGGYQNRPGFFRITQTAGMLKPAVTTGILRGKDSRQKVEDVQQRFHIPVPA